MPRRPAFLTMVTALLLVTAGCATVLGTGGTPTDTGPAQADPTVLEPTDNDGPTIEIAAGGQVQTQPDQAVLRVAVESSGQNASVVRRRLAENVSSMRSALTAMGIEEDRITTVDYDIRNQRRFGGREEDRPPVWGRHAFSITLTDLNRTGEVVVTAVENGATSVDDVRFTLSEGRRTELRERALSKAMANARDRAGVVADGANLTVVGVGSVTTADVGVRPVRFEAAALAVGANAGTSIEGGAVTVTARVRVTYNATADA